MQEREKCRCTYSDMGYCHICGEPHPRLEDMRILAAASCAGIETQEYAEEHGEAMKRIVQATAISSADAAEAICRAAKRLNISMGDIDEIVDL